MGSLAGIMLLAPCCPGLCTFSSRPWNCTHRTRTATALTPLSQQDQAGEMFASETFGCWSLQQKGFNNVQHVLNPISVYVCIYLFIYIYIYVYTHVCLITIDYICFWKKLSMIDKCIVVSTWTNCFGFSKSWNKEHGGTRVGVAAFLVPLKQKTTFDWWHDPIIKLGICWFIMFYPCLSAFIHPFCMGSNCSKQDDRNSSSTKWLNGMLTRFFPRRIRPNWCKDSRFLRGERWWTFVTHWTHRSRRPPLALGFRTTDSDLTSWRLLSETAGPVQQTAKVCLYTWIRVHLESIVWRWYLMIFEYIIWNSFW